MFILKGHLSSLMLGVVSRRENDRGAYASEVYSYIGRVRN